MAGEKIVERVEREKHCDQSPLSEENQAHLTRNPRTEPLIKIQWLLHIILFKLHHLFLGLYFQTLLGITDVKPNSSQH